MSGMSGMAGMGMSGMEAGMRDYSMDDYSRKVTPKEIKSAMAQSCANCKKYKLWSCFYLARYGYDMQPDGWCMKWGVKGKQLKEDQHA
jgi:hypothetical protein